MNTNLTWRRITTTALGAGAIAVGALAMGAPAANALTFEQSCTTQPGAYARGAVLGVYSTARRGNDRDEICKVYDVNSALLGTTYQTNYNFFGKPAGPTQVAPPAQSPR
jgi:hypothetical protein